MSNEAQSNQAATKLNIIGFDDLEQLSQMFSEEKNIFIEKDKGTVVRIKIRPLTDAQMAAANRLNDLTPPKITKKLAGGGTEEEYDFYNEGHRKELAAKTRLRRAFILDLGLVGFKIPGESTEKKAEYLENNYPPRILKVLLAEIEGISSTDIKTLEAANFTSGADSTQS